MKAIPLELEYDDVETHRRGDCVSYSDCLMAIAKKRLEGFSCLDCENYERDPEFEIEPVVDKPNVNWPYSLNIGDKPTRAEMRVVNKAMEKMGIKQFNIMHREPK